MHGQVDAIMKCALLIKTFIAHCAFGDMILYVHVCSHCLYAMKEVCVLCVTVALFRT